MINQAFILLLFTITCNIVSGLEPEQSPNTFLFCLKPELQLLTISLNRGKPSVGMAELDDYFQAHEVVRIEPWIKSATEMDRDGDIYLNRIYRSYIDENSLGRTDQSIASIQDFPFILYAEPEYIHQLFYEPNDDRFDNQCLDDMRVDLAWDYWDIPNETPGDKNILLASIDTGVDYTHPDLIDNIWVNQGEIRAWVWESGEVDIDDNGYVSALEINNYIQDNQLDENNDGEINVVDIVQLVAFILTSEPYNILADINEDGLINVLDVVILVNIILEN